MVHCQLDFALNVMMRKTVATIRDVATAAGVSTSTISKFVNRTKRFSPDVEARISSVIEELGYRSNPLAQSMITGRTNTIALSVMDIMNPYFTNLLRGANSVAQARGYTVLLVENRDSLEAERKTIEMLSRRVDGLIVYPHRPPQELQWLAQLAPPIVYCGLTEPADFPGISSDDHQGGFMLARHLLMQGHQKIAYLGCPGSRRNSERINGVREALAQQGLSLSVFETDSAWAEGGKAMCAAIMLGRDTPDALICFNDLVALGFMKAAQLMGFSLPRDISVAGFDNIQFDELATPALTSVDLQSARMGACAMEKLLDLIEGRSVEPHTVIGARLVQRESTMMRRSD